MATYSNAIGVSSQIEVTSTLGFHAAGVTTLLTCAANEFARVSLNFSNREQPVISMNLYHSNGSTILETFTFGALTKEILVGPGQHISVFNNSIFTYQVSYQLYGVRFVSGF